MPHKLERPAGEVRQRLLNLAATPEPGLVSAGIYVLERSVLEAIPAGRAVSLEREVWPQLLDGRLRGLALAGAFTDMGVPEAYAALQADPSPLLALAQGVPA